MPGTAFGPPTRAWVRGVSNVYAACIRSGDAPIDVALARAQHAAYVRALEQAGVLVTHLPADHDAADCCFIEDTAVLCGAEAVLTRPGASAREAETKPVGAALRAAGIALVEMTGDARLDGGDVMRLGSTLVVGLSARTNDDGVAALRTCAERCGLTVHALTVRAGLHLKSALTLLDPTRLLMSNDSAVDPDALRDFDVEVIVTEPEGANVLALGSRVLVSAAAPTTAELVRAAGLEPVVLDISQMHCCDGALTCLSLRQAPAGAWCA